MGSQRRHLGERHPESQREGRRYPEGRGALKEGYLGGECFGTGEAHASPRLPPASAVEVGSECSRQLVHYGTSAPGKRGKTTTNKEGCGNHTRGEFPEARAHFQLRIREDLVEENVAGTTQAEGRAEKGRATLAGVPQWVGRCPAKRKVASSIPNQGMCRGCWFGPRLGCIQEATHWIFLSPSPSLKEKVSGKCSRAILHNRCPWVVQYGGPEKVSGVFSGNQVSARAGRVVKPITNGLVW